MLTHKEKLAMVRRAFESRESDYSRTEVNVLFEEISLLEAEVERLRAEKDAVKDNYTLISNDELKGLYAEIERLQQYTDPKLFAAASQVLEVAGKGSDGEVDLALVMLGEAVAWWDSLPFDPAADTEKLPKYEE